MCGLVPRLPVILLLVVRIAVKNEEGLGAFITWITSSGCEVEVGREWPNQKKAHWIICSSALPLFWTPDICGVETTSLLTFKLGEYIFEYWSSHYVHLASTQVMITPRPSRFLATLLFPCINVSTIKWKIKWRRPGLACKKSPAKKEVLSCISMVCSLECWAHKETAVFTLGQSYICPWC